MPQDDGVGDFDPASEDEQPHTLIGVLERLENAGDGVRVSVAEIAMAVGRRAFAPVMLAPALLIVSPASGIPGLSSIVGILIALVAAQILLRRRTLWLPGFIARRTVRRTTLHKAVRFLAPVSRFVDRWTFRRLAALTEPPFDVVPVTICLAVGLIMPLFEFVPFTSSILAAAVSLFALSMVTRDGLLSMLGLVIIGGAVVFGWMLAERAAGVAAG